MKISALLVVCGWLFTAPVLAGTVDIFLLKAQGDTIENLNLASEQGHTIIYHFLDAQQHIEDKLSKDVEDALSRLFTSVRDGLSIAELNALGDEGITERVMELAASDSEFLQQAQVMKSVANDPDIKAALIQAHDDQQRAAALGIQMHDLPAVVFQAKQLNNVSDLVTVLTSGGAE